MKQNEIVTPPDVLEEFKRTYQPLALRVREGNDKLIAAYLKIMDLPEEKEAVFNSSMDRIAAAARQLDRLCLQLEVIEEVLKGKAGCLYIMSNGQKVRKCWPKDKTPLGKEVETFCWACPSARAYWREEANIFKLWED